MEEGGEVTVTGELKTSKGGARQRAECAFAVLLAQQLTPGSGPGTGAGLGKGGTQ